MIIDNGGELVRLAVALGGIPVLACRPVSSAQPVGVRYGDIVLAVNGVKTPDWASFLEARERDGVKMRLALVRDGTRLEIEVELPGATPVDPSSLLADLLTERSAPIGAPVKKRRARGTGTDHDT